LLPKEICSVKEIDPKTGKKVVKDYRAFKITRYQPVTVDASLSKNVK
jgi:hypothetical protein